MKNSFQKSTIYNDVSRGSIFAYSQIGFTHSSRNSLNQDSFGYFTFENTFSIAVADGVGSCKYSQFGAKAAVQTIKELSETLTINMLTDIEIMKYIVSGWKSKIPKKPNDFATTLRFAIVIDDDIIIGDIGDGLTMLTSDEEFYSFTNNGTFANQTLALQNDTQFDDINIYHQIKKSKTLISIMTDGISNELDTAKHENFMNYIENKMVKDTVFENEINSWINSLNTKNGDDKTIVFMELHNRQNLISEEKL